MTQAQKQVEARNLEVTLTKMSPEYNQKQREFSQKFLPTAYMNLKILSKTYRVCTIE